jgi:alkylhydroperoxidase family enzyme
MARLPYLNKEDLPPEYQSILDRPINLNRILANSPACRKASSETGQYIRFGSKLDPRLRELAILQVGYLARAAYEWSHHIKIAHEFNISEDNIGELVALNEGKATNFDANTLTVLDAAREMTVGGAISKPTFEALRGFLNNSLIVDLVVTIAHYNGIVRLLASLEVDVEDSYLPYLEKFPLPTTPATA